MSRTSKIPLPEPPARRARPANVPKQRPGRPPQSIKDTGDWGIEEAEVTSLDESSTLTQLRALQLGIEDIDPDVPYVLPVGVGDEFDLDPNSVSPADTFRGDAGLRASNRDPFIGIILKGNIKGAKIKVLAPFSTDGGAATIYRGEIIAGPDKGTPCLIKRLDPQLARDYPELAERFEREIDMLANTISPYVVRLIDRDNNERPAYYVMEIIKGTPLDKMATPLPLKRALHYLKNTLQGLIDIDEARGHNATAHRDLKPDNVIITERDNDAKIIDLGTAYDEIIPDSAKIGRRSSTIPARITIQGVCMGTPDYMPPEGWYGADKINQLGDLYSLALMAIFMLTGTAPCDPRAIVNTPGPDGQTIAEDNLIKATLRIRNGLLAQKHDNIPEALWNLLTNLLSNVPQDRLVKPERYDELEWGMITKYLDRDEQSRAEFLANLNDYTGHRILTISLQRKLPPYEIPSAYELMLEEIERVEQAIVV